MSGYVDLGITTDASQLYQDGVDAITSLADPGWVPSPIESWLLSAVARMASEVAVLAGQVPLWIFVTFGETVLKVDAITATPAIGSVTFTTTDANGPYTVEAGAQVTIDGVAFTTDTDLTIPNGSTTGSVPITAINEGLAGSGLTGAQVDLESPTYLFVDSVALDSVTTSGIDAETPDEYGTRLARDLPTLSPKAILIADFAALALANAAVGRALAIDNYNPGPPPDTAAEGHVTVAVQDPAGGTLASGTKTAIATDLASDGNRVLNLTVHVIDPTFTTVGISFVATAEDGWDPATVRTDAIAALQEFLDHAAWGRPQGADTTAWVDEPMLRRNDLMGVLYQVPGLRHVTASTIGRARAVTAVAATDVLTATAHGYANGDAVILAGLTGGVPIAAPTVYYVRDVTANTFKLAATAGGAAIDITSDLTAGYVYPAATADVALDGPAALPTLVAATGTVT